MKAEAKMMFKILHNMRPNCLKELLLSKRKYQTTIFVTAQAFARSNSLKKSFMCDGTSIWNSIPENIRESKICYQVTHRF
jgi:hypothetical protein